MAAVTDEVLVQPVLELALKADKIEEGQKGEAGPLRRPHGKNCLPLD